uniref:Uncharacterized protein n=1 Tax=Ixodes ricinus TaxID=34613 RepID=A0A6B0U655_IXORI
MASTIFGPVMISMVPYSSAWFSEAVACNCLIIFTSSSTYFCMASSFDMSPSRIHASHFAFPMMSQNLGFGTLHSATEP